MTGAAPRPAASVVMELRAATSAAHAALSELVIPDEALLDRVRYRWFLRRLWGFHRAVDRALPVDPLPEVSGRPPRAELLAADLKSIGGWSEHLPEMPGLTEPERRAGALGIAYVVEGSALGGIQLLTLAQQRLHLTRHRGASFFAAGADGVPRWRHVKEELQRGLAEPSELAEAQQAAHATFAALGAWMTSATEPDGT